LAYATGSTGLAITVRGSSRRIMIMRFRPANIRLINRRSKLLRLLLVLSSGKQNANHQNNPTDLAQLTRSLHIRPMHSLRIIYAPKGRLVMKNAPVFLVLHLYSVMKVVDCPMFCASEKLV
jgi:hypothetical protein